MWGLLRDVDIVIVIGTSGKVVNIHHIIENANYSILNNLEYSNSIIEKKFNKIIYDRATIAIDEIREIIET